MNVLKRKRYDEPEVISDTPPKQRRSSSPEDLLSASDSEHILSQCSNFSSSAGSGDTAYEIRGIIGERRREYLIDWADNPTTGEAYPPDWQPKGNVNAAAIAVWNARQAISKSRRKAGNQLTLVPTTGPINSTSGCRKPQWQSSSRELEHSRASTDHQFSDRSFESSLPAIRAPSRVYRPVQETVFSETLAHISPSTISTLQTLGESQRQEAVIDSGPIIQDSQPASDSRHPIDAPDSSSTSEDTDSLPSQIDLKTQILQSQVITRTEPPDSPKVPYQTKIALTSSVSDSFVSHSTSSTNRRSLDRACSDSGLISYQASDESIARLGDTGSIAHTRASSGNRERTVFRRLSDRRPIFRPDTRAAPAASKTEDHLPPSESITSNLETLARVQTAFDVTTGKSEISKQALSDCSRIEYYSFSEYQDSLKPPRPRSSTSIGEYHSSSIISGSVMTESCPVRHEVGNDTSMSNSDVSLSTRERLQISSDIVDAKLAQQRQERQRILSESHPISPRSSYITQASGEQSGHASDPSLGANQRTMEAATTSQGSQRVDALQNVSDQSSGPIPQSPLDVTQSFSHTASLPSSDMKVEASPLAVEGASLNSITQDSQSSVSMTAPNPSLDSMETTAKVEGEQSRLEAQPLEIEVIQEPPLPVRALVSVPHTPVTPSKLSIHREISISPNNNILDLTDSFGGNEFVIPLSMPPRIQEQYCTTIKYHAKAIKHLMEERSYSSESIDRINVLFDEISKVTVHIDLQGSGPSSQEEVNAIHEAEYAESCSEKFVFLGQLLESCSESSTPKIAIVARPGRLQDILRTYVHAKGYTCNTVPDSIGGNVSGQSVWLYDSCTSEASSISNEVDIVVAFDETCRFLQASSSLQHQKTQDSSLVPLIVRPVVYASLEHIDLCLARSLPPIERLQKLIFSLLQTQKRVGVMDLDEPAPDLCAQKVYEFASAPRITRLWQLPPIKPIDDIAFIEPDAQSSESTLASDLDRSMRFWPDLPSSELKEMPLQKNGKRPFDLEWGDSVDMQSKKQRLAQECNSRPASQANHSLRRNSLRLEVAAENAVTEKKRFAEHLTQKEIIIDDLRKWAELRQYAFEKLRQEKGNLEVDCSTAQEQLVKQSKETEQLRNKIESLSATVKETERTLKALSEISGDQSPIVAEAATREVKLRALEGEVASLKKKLANTEKDFEFTRQAYQQASNAAADQQRELDDLQPELASLRAKEKSDLAAYRRLRDADVTKDLRKELQRLKASIKQKDAFIHKIESENYELKRGRTGVQTRGSSVQPKSPRGPSSRGVSPAASMLGPQGQSIGLTMSHPMIRGGSGRGNRFID